MNVNFFKSGTGLFPLRWFIMFAIALIAAFAAMDTAGYRLFSGGNQQQWSAGGPGYHK